MRWVYEKDGVLRAEVEGADGVKRGLYTVAGEDGQIKTQAYISGGDQGHRLVEFGDLGIDLPPLPYDLHPKAGQRKFPAVVDEDEVSVEADVVLAESHPVEIQPFGTYKEDVEAIVIEASKTGLGRNNQDDEVAVGALAGAPRQYEAAPKIVNHNTNNHLFYNPQVSSVQTRTQKI